jgi:hypothetical protein
MDLLGSERLRSDDRLGLFASLTAGARRDVLIFPGQAGKYPTHEGYEFRQRWVRANDGSARSSHDAMASYERVQKTRFFPSMDGLRCLSILAVLAFHCQIPVPGYLGQAGFLGVRLFFVISGLLITTLLLRERDSNGVISLKSFYIRRTLRIFPLYYAVLALFALSVLAFDRHTPEGAMHQPAAERQPDVHSSFQQPTGEELRR